MKILLVHQNFPGQFLYLAPELRRRGHEVLALTDLVNKRETDIPTLRYRFEPPAVDPAATRLGRNYTLNSDRGVVVARACKRLREDKGYVPDLILGHSGWGETLFLKEVWPEAKLVVYAEFYYRGSGADTGFDSEFNAGGFDQMLIAQGRTTHLGQALLHADAGLAPTRWQASTYPPALQKMIRVIFDGVDTDVVSPDPKARLALPNGRVLEPGDEVLTFVNRNLEPYRGYHIFMRALPGVLAARPKAQVVIIGGDEVSYGAANPEGGSWKDRFLAEVQGKLDLARVHFLGRVPYATFLQAMQVSRVHAYLTYPFVLSWSMLEAMAAETLVVGSDTAPVREVIKHGKNGLLVDFFDVAAWTETLTEALAKPGKYAPMRAAARKKVLRDYDLRGECLPRLVEFVEGLVAGA